MPYLIKYSSEIGTKSPRMKWKFIHKLAETLRSGAKMQVPKGEEKKQRIHALSNHIILESDEDLKGLLARTSGVQYFAKAETFRYESEELFLERASELFRPLVSEAGTFAVKARTRGETPIGRKRTEVALGDRLVDLAGVNLDDPQITCYVELDGDTVHLYTEKIPGMGGTPLGIQGTVLNLFSGGIDSPVAAWRSYRVGLDQHFLYFDLGGQEQKRSGFELYRFLKSNYGHGSSGKLIEVDLIPAIAEIRKAEPRYQNLILKYLFYRTAEAIARIHSAHSLITGESLGQVSTQTGRNLITLDRCIGMSVHRPLFSFTKEEIKKSAASIGTYERSYKGKEFCALTTKKVTTGASYKELMKVLEGIDMEALIQEAVDSRLLWDLNAKGELEAREPASKKQKEREDREDAGTGISEADHIIDLRSDDELGDAAPQGERVPFERAMEEYFHWDPKVSYHFICNYGSKSRIIAHYMRKEGFRAGYSEGGAFEVKN